MNIWETDLAHYHSRRMMRWARLAWLGGTLVGILIASAVMMVW